jgi:formylglycine-generating enzyme required for sulfatase activity
MRRAGGCGGASSGGCKFTWGALARTSRGLRGGSWNNNENNLRSSNRNDNDATNENNNIGFRVASL